MNGEFPNEPEPQPEPQPASQTCTILQSSTPETQQAIQASSTTQNTSSVTPENPTSITNLESILEDSESQYKFLDANFEQLTIGDLRQLLEDYKSLARQNELLKNILASSKLPAQTSEETSNSTNEDKPLRRRTNSTKE
jgi:hypothetical protein